MNSGMESIFYLGSVLDKDKGSIWNKVGEEALSGSPYYFPIVDGKDYRSKFSKNRDFFLLYQEGRPIARACTLVEQKPSRVADAWKKAGIEVEPEDKVGSIRDFAIIPEYQDKAGELISYCLSNLKHKGVEAVMVKGHFFPALLRRGKGIPPFPLIYTPSWYIDIFKRNGFKVVKEWVSYSINLEGLPPSDFSLDHAQVQIRPMGIRDRKKMQEFMARNFPQREDVQTLFRRRSFVPMFLFQKWLMKTLRMYMVVTDPGKISGYIRYTVIPEPSSLRSSPPRRFDIIKFLHIFRKLQHSRSILLIGMRMDQEMLRDERIRGIHQETFLLRADLLRKAGFKWAYATEPRDNPVLFPLEQGFFSEFNSLRPLINRLKYYTLAMYFSHS